MSCRNLGADCPDDICRGTGVCMDYGLPRAERCPACGRVSLPDLDVFCDCEKAEWSDEDYDAYAALYGEEE